MLEREERVNQVAQWEQEDETGWGTNNRGSSDWTDTPTEGQNSMENVD